MNAAKSLTDTSEDRVQKVAKYLEIMIGLNRQHLKMVVKGKEKLVNVTEQEIKVLAYAAVMGDISTVKSRTGCQKYLSTSRHSLNNAISKLTRLGLLTKTDRTRVHPDLQLDFTKNINLIINLNEQAGDSKNSSREA